MKKLGLIVNPIAGMGGSVGLKGTDGVLSEAISRGAVPRAEEKTVRALRKLLLLTLNAEAKLTIITCGGDMGENSLLKLMSLESCNSELNLPEASFSYEVVYSSQNAKTDITGAENSNFASAGYKNMTSAEDTKAGASAIAFAGADIIAFVGGDGTARDIYGAVGESLPVLGIPAGVKVYSPVYAQSPEKAGELLRLYLSGQTTLTKEVEVLDINEDDYRKDIINTSLYGYLRVPYERRFLQSRKAPSPMSEEARQRAIATYIAEDIMQIRSKAGAQKGKEDAKKGKEGAQNGKEDAQQVKEYVSGDTYYIIGPGSTTRCLADYLGVENALLGVDIVHKKQAVEEQTNAKTGTEAGTNAVIKTVVKDATEKELLAYLETDQTADGVKKTPAQPKQIKLIITPTGGQGYLLGRGNQQISAEVIKKLGQKSIIVIATQEKLAGLLGEPLRVDTGDAEADELLRGYVKVITGYKEMQMYRVE